MATKPSFKRKITASVQTTDATGPIGLTGDQALSLIRQYNAHEPILKFKAPVTSSPDGPLYDYYVNFNCICSIIVKDEKGDNYKKPDCDPAYCVPTAAEQEVLMKDEIKVLTDEEWYDHLFYPNRKPAEIVEAPKAVDKKKKVKKDEVPTK